MHVKFKVIGEVNVDGYQQFHQGDSGLDLCAKCDVTIAPWGTAKIEFGLAAEAVDAAGRPTSFWLLPRSSIVKTPLRQANSIGLIDAGYRGQLMAYVDNFSSELFTVAAGARYFQIASPQLEPITFEFTDSLTETTRGEGGFGSTGK